LKIFENFRKFSEFFRQLPPVEIMAKGVAYKYEPQLDLDVSVVKKSNARQVLPSVSIPHAKKAAKAGKLLAQPMSMDEFDFAFVDDVYGTDRSAAAAAVKAAAAAAVPTPLFDVPDDIFNDDTR
jgi:hypothetical protein